MIKFACNTLSLARRNVYSFATESEGAGFLKMVEEYFDKAGALTNIKPDRLNFYKKADNVVKFNLTLTRGTFFTIKTMAPSKSSPPTDANTRPINYPPREEPDTPKTLTSMKSKPSPVS
jgi:hypothetical protein